LAAVTPFSVHHEAANAVDTVEAADGGAAYVSTSFAERIWFAGSWNRTYDTGHDFPPASSCRDCPKLTVGRSWSIYESASGLTTMPVVGGSGVAVFASTRPEAPSGTAIAHEMAITRETRRADDTPTRRCDLPVPPDGILTAIFATRSAL
jgi:hypothetical protein